VTPLFERLEELRRIGALGFDRPGFRFIETLLQRSTELDGPAAERLVMRARQRLSALESALRQARAEAEGALATARAAGCATAALETLYTKGDFREVVQGARRALLALDRPEGGAVERLRRLHRRAMAQGLALPSATLADIERLARDGAALEAEDEVLARVLGDELARALFRDAASQARAVLVVARAADRVPDDVGPYNPQALSAQTLSLIESLAPGYLRTCLAGLEDVASLRRLPEPPKRPRRRR
jgi:hypothetical protein